MQTRTEAEILAAKASAGDPYSQAETNYRQQRHLSDDELRAWMTEQASLEKAEIRQAVDEKRVYVVAGKDAHRVHLYDCSSLREQIDRDHAWSFWQIGSAESFRLQLAHGDGGPRMPELVDRAAIEALRSYVTCQICAPSVSHTSKSRGVRTTKLTSLSARHIGRELSALDGTSLGLLERIITTIDRYSSSVAVQTSTVSFDETEHPAVIVGPAVSGTVSSGSAVSTE
ncbi:hypothetical protein SAMN06295879_3570 [Agreia bicolorata]|uniref:Uncharacterized protein n=1 Tax=Agreia bicolorata TaxID=110935 RepID=A0A1T4YLL9_9MICO|nr:hypothetical protein [Agreia bicolorata]SKB02727.1 hypothetical protein SAMN06295879_3570 [Agreia bicolorata]